MEETDQFEYLKNKHAEYPEDMTDQMWHFDDYTLSWGERGLEEDIINIDGDTYSGFVLSKDGTEDYMIFEVEDNCGGNSSKLIFKKSNRINE